MIEFDVNYDVEFDEFSLNIAWYAESVRKSESFISNKVFESGNQP